MNKKNIILICVSLALVTGIIGVVFYYQSLRTVTFTFTNNDTDATLHKVEKDNVLSSLGPISNGQQKLQTGDYSITLKNSKYDRTPTKFSVTDKDMEVAIDPSYSSSELERMLTEEMGAITAIIDQTYASIIKEYTVKRGNLYKKGQWYTTTLVQKVPQSEEGDIYRLVLKKEQDTWKIVTIPALILSAKDYPNIPIDILRAVNKKNEQ